MFKKLLLCFVLAAAVGCNDKDNGGGSGGGGGGGFGGSGGFGGGGGGALPTFGQVGASATDANGYCSDSLMNSFELLAESVFSDAQAILNIVEPIMNSYGTDEQKALQIQAKEPQLRPYVESLTRKCQGFIGQWGDFTCMVEESPGYTEIIESADLAEDCNNAAAELGI